MANGLMSFFQYSSAPSLHYSKDEIFNFKLGRTWGSVKLAGIAFVVNVDYVWVGTIFHPD